MKNQINYKNIFTTLFSHLAQETDAQLTIENLLKYPNTTGVDTKLVKIVFDQKQKLISIIGKTLPNWSFYRLGQVEQVITLVGAAAITSGLDDKALIIDHCLNHARTLCEPQAFSIVNKILDKIVSPKN